MSVTELQSVRQADGTKDERPFPDDGDPEDQSAATGEQELVDREPDKPPMQVPLPGDFTGISTEFGGLAPEFSEIRLLGGKMPIDGSFEKGTEFDVLVRVKVTGVLGQDVTDEWGTITRTIRRHMARMISVRRPG